LKGNSECHLSLSSAPDEDNSQSYIGLLEVQFRQVSKIPKDRGFTTALGTQSHAAFEMLHS